jgi:hypothetical protein
MPETAAKMPLLPADIAREAVYLVRSRLLQRPLTVLFAPQRYRNSINVRRPDTGDIEHITLDKCVDVSWAVDGDELLVPISEFTNQYLIPAAYALAECIDRDIATANSTAVPPGAAVVFAIPHTDDGALDAVETADGVAVRVQYHAEDTRVIITLDALYGITAPQPMPAA